MSDEMDHLLTPAQKRAKTREAKKQAMLEQMGVEPRKKTKVKRKRKPMSPEQKAAAVERLALARAKRNAGKEPNAHPRVLAFDEDHPLSFKNSKETLKEWREKLKSIRHQKDSKDTKLRAEYQECENYVKNLGVWIRDGVWLDHKYGRKHDQVMEYVCVAMAYDKDGMPKRDVGTYYADIREVWTKEMQEEQRNAK